LTISTIAIDGTAASGKSTVGQLLAERLGFLYFDTGAMYRAVTWCALQRNGPLQGEAAVTALAEELHIEVVAPTTDDGRQYTVLADGDDVTWHIRRPEVDANVSLVSTYPGVRNAMVRQQRRIAAQGRIVMVGRDIGSVVLPQADLKVYLDATAEERARRRWKEKRERGEEVDREKILAEMRRRDRIDSHREASPLCVPEGALMIDTTHMDIAEVVEEILQCIRELECQQD